MRVCYMGSYDKSLLSPGRHQVIQAGLRAHGVEVVECHDASRGLLRRWLRLRGQFRRVGRVDALIVGEQSHAVVPLAWLLCRLRRIPLLFDPHISLYDTAVHDRRECAPRSPRGRLLYRLDWISMHLADIVFSDTRTHGAYFAETFRLPPEKLRTIHVGADESIFHPPETPPARGTHAFEVLFYGSYIQVHGMEAIFDAVARLEPHGDIHFTIIGHDFVEPSYRGIYGNIPRPPNATMVGRVPLERLPDRIASADVCLGIFGTTEKAGRAVPTKAYQIIACGRPLVTADTPAAREVFHHGEDAWLIPAGSGEALARAILHLQGDPALRERLAAGGLALYRSRFTPGAIGGSVLSALREVVGKEG
ncbi:MAG: glycosyltransferase [Euryarchaeota archaeon]|nr:glycosyltransferase [Euryarchaeota archaeon]